MAVRVCLLKLALTATVIASSLGLPAFASGLMPPVTAQDLNERQIRLPAQLPAARTLVLIAYKREQQSNINTWIDGMNLKARDLPWLELPVLEDYGTWFQWFVDNGMRRGIKGEFNRSKVVTVYTNKADFNNALGIPSEDSIYAAVINQQGEVEALVAGDYSSEAAKRLEALLSAP